MIKILFMIHDLCPGGAEKVLVNLVNNMDAKKYDITVLSLFDEGIHRYSLKPHIHYKYAFKKMVRGNSQFMKILSPRVLHSLIVKEKYDIEVSYLEGPCARIISGCIDNHVKKVAWIHRTMDHETFYKIGFRNKVEADRCYSCFDQIVCVSKGIEESFKKYYTGNKTKVLYNTNESEIIRLKADETCIMPALKEPIMVSVGTLKEIKGFDRLLRIALRLSKEGIDFGLLIIGGGPLYESLNSFIEKNRLEKYVKLLGNQDNPYKYVKQCDLYVCSSHSEGFSTAATEALILGVPVCTVEVSGMKEMLGENNQYGVITENNDEQLYYAVKNMLLNHAMREQYKEKAIERGKIFSTSNTVNAVDKMLTKLRG